MLKLSPGKTFRLSPDLISFLGLLLLAFVAAAFPAATPKTAPRSTMQQKLDYLRANSLLAHPDPKPTTFTEQEINAYIAAGGLELPAGVESLRFASQPGVVTAFARVDFDKVRAGSRSMNPLLAVFSGVHEVVAVAHGSAARGEATVHLDSVSLDDVEVPNFALAMFAAKFIAPKHPNLGVDSRFALPERIDSAVVGVHVVTVEQR